MRSRSATDPGRSVSDDNRADDERAARHEEPRGAGQADVRRGGGSPGAGVPLRDRAALAERLGYPAAELDVIPAEAIESYAGVGYFLDLAAIAPGETVVDLGSGSGTDTLPATVQTGLAGHVIGVDMTTAQLRKAARLATAAGVGRVEFRHGYIEPFRSPMPVSTW